MGDREAEDRGRGVPDPAQTWLVSRLSAHDLRLALELAERLGLDGWRVEWSGPIDGSWEARVGCPSIAVPVAARGRSRVSAISRAHLEAIRRSALGPEGPSDRRDRSHLRPGPASPTRFDPRNFIT